MIYIIFLLAQEFVNALLVLICDCVMSLGVIQLTDPEQVKLCLDEARSRIDIGTETDNGIFVFFKFNNCSTLYLQPCITRTLIQDRYVHLCERMKDVYNF